MRYRRICAYVGCKVIGSTVVTQEIDTSLADFKEEVEGTFQVEVRDMLEEQERKIE